LVVSGVLALPVSGLAQEQLPVPEASTWVSGGTPVDPGLNRPFLFMTDPSLPAPGHFIGSAGLGSVTRTGELRPDGAGSLLPTLGMEAGLLPWMSLYAEGEFAYASADGSPTTNAGFEVGAHILLTSPASRTVRVALQTSVGRDLSAATKVLINATATWDIQKLRLAGSLQGAHDFQGGADGVDLTGMAALSYELPLNFRVGGELIAQDLEEIGGAAAEGGVAAFAGPTVGWELAQRFQIVVGPSFGLTAGAPQVVARGVASILF
jgi:hypothetical protein